MKAETITSSVRQSARAAFATAVAAGLPLLGVTVLAYYGPSIASWLSSLPLPVVIMTLFAAGAFLSGGALLPTHAVSLASGFVLGPVLGPFISWFSITLGAFVSFSLGKLLAGRGLMNLINAHPRFQAIHHALLRSSRQKSIALVALVRLSPLAPFAATNVALAAFGVRLREFIIGSMAGLAPRIAIVAWLGAGMAELDWSKANSPALLILGTVATVIALILVGVAAKRALTQELERIPSV